MKTLYLHIGSSKTGTSFLQSSFAYSREFLKQNGVHYPVLSEHSGSKYGIINSGNGGILANLLNVKLSRSPTFKNDTAWSDFLFALDSDCKHILISNENLQYAEKANIELLCKELSKKNIEIKVIIFLRSFLGYLYSSWQQGLKRKGQTATFNETCFKTKNLHFLNTLINYSDIIGLSNLYIYNYDIRKKKLLDVFRNILGTNQLDKPSCKLINPSLTDNEISELTFLNQLSQTNTPNISNKVSKIVSDLMQKLTIAMNKHLKQILI